MLKPFQRRFASYGLFKYWWRALEANFEDDYKVHLLLMQESQIPAFLRRDDPRIVFHYHRDFISARSRPCFDSSTIELSAMHSISFSPVYLLVNDDMYFNQKCSARDFSDGSTPLTKIAVKERYGDGLFQVALENGRRLVEAVTGRSCPAYAWHHLFQAYQEEYTKRFLNAHWAYIEKRLGKFRHSRDMNHLMLMMAQNLEGVSRHSIDFPTDGYFECPTLASVPRERLEQPKVICLNDVNSIGIGCARAYLEYRYPEKCSFEV